MTSLHIIQTLTLTVGYFFLHFPVPSISAKVCIIGAGIGGTSTAYFLRNFSQNFEHDIHVFEAGGKPGGRVSTIEFEGDYFDSGASIIHEKNFHLVRFARLLGLKPVPQLGDTEILGIWNGKEFVYRDVILGKDFWSRQVSGWINSFRILWRYGIKGLIQMQLLVKALLDQWSLLYLENRDVYTTVEDLLSSINLYQITQKKLWEILIENGLSPLLINEIVTMIIRINYNQNATISGLAGAVGLAGSSGALWAVEGGNQQIPEGILILSNATFYPNTRITTVTRSSDSNKYVLEVGSDKEGRKGAGEGEGKGVGEGDGEGKGEREENETHTCDAVVIAVPLEEGKLELVPSVSVPFRRYQHTYTTFVRGHLNSNYFGVSEDEIPTTIGTTETEEVPFSSISVLKQYGAKEFTYKIFSRKTMEDELLDRLFRWRRPVTRIDWAAYPKYEAPEKFAPFLLDDYHLYYINTFESAASAMETAAVSAHNVARLLLKRIRNSKHSVDIFGVNNNSQSRGNSSLSSLAEF